MSEPADSYSDLIVYVDESGDHGPVSEEYPVFVLAFCIFQKNSYADQVTSLMHQLKFRHFGHDTVVLHEREIRKNLAPFQFLQIARRKTEFMDDISRLIEQAPFELVAAAIRKDQLHTLYQHPDNSYHLALKFGLERLQRHREALGDTGVMHVVFESRGNKEDGALELEFRRICDQSPAAHRMQMEPVFARKHANHCGLQFADLVARPIGVHVLRPKQPNRAFELLSKKFRKSPEGQINGWGLKCFP